MFKFRNYVLLKVISVICSKIQSISNPRISVKFEGKSTKVQRIKCPFFSEKSKFCSKKKAKFCRALEIALAALRRAWKMLQNEPLVAKFRFDTAENELSEVDFFYGLDRFGRFR